MRFFKRLPARTILSPKVIFLSIIALSACSLSDLVNKTKLPSDVVDPKSVQNEQGALALYRATLVNFARAIGNSRTGPALIEVVGTLTDELTTGGSEFPRGFGGALDARNYSEGGSDQDPYRKLQVVRGFAREARGMLRLYVPKAPNDLIGHLFAIEGMADILLSELYCSGIPLSTIDFSGDYTLTAGFSTSDVLSHAMSLFDSADTYTKDSVRIQYFIQVARGRALLARGQTMAANIATKDVPTSFQYTLTFAAASDRLKFVPMRRVLGDAYVGTREGLNGLPFGNASDPRTILPSLYDSVAPLVLSSGIEARLIEAEAALSAQKETWLTTLNQLRTTCRSVEECPSPAPAGDGGVSGLIPLSDPTPGASLSDTAANRFRLKLIFDERAYWLFLRGHRQGDLRRLVRNYKWPQRTVYPIGSWSSLVEYGDDVNIPLPQQEMMNNSLYRGCFNRDA